MTIRAPFQPGGKLGAIVRDNPEFIAWMDEENEICHRHRTREAAMKCPDRHGKTLIQTIRHTVEIQAI